MGQTVNWQLPYPELADPADVPADMKKLADKLETSLTTAAGTAPFIYGTEAARPAAVAGNNGVGYFATDTGNIYISNGSSWMRASGSAPQRVTTMPTTPTDGQEIELSDNAANPTWTWVLRYNASRSDAYKWERVSGETLLDSSAMPTLQTSTSTGAPLTSPVYFTTPRPGIYWVEYHGLTDGLGLAAGYGSAQFQPNVRLVLNGTEVQTLAPWLLTHEDGTNVNQWRAQSHSVVLAATATFAAAGATVQVRIDQTISSYGQLRGERLCIRPIRIS